MNPHFLNFYQKLLLILIFLAITSLFAFPLMAHGNDVQLPYNPTQWAQTYLQDIPACGGNTFDPDSGAYNTTNIHGYLPVFGYPHHYALIKGVNDTLHALIGLYFLGTKYLPLANCGQWFAPQVYSLSDYGSGGPAFRDSTQLKYRLRGWYSSLEKVKAIDTLRYQNGGIYALKLDIWNLPEGQFQFCIQPTNHLPSDFTAITNGQIMQYYPARDLADSCNGYEGCFWRAVEDTDYTAAETWADKILNINPTSVPGWWLKSYNAWNKRDTSATKDALDKAITFFDGNDDPAMPNPNKRAISIYERDYRVWIRESLTRNRNSFGP